MTTNLPKLVSQVFATLLLIVVAATLLKELSAQSELIQSLAAFFGLALFIAVIAVIVRIADFFR